MRRPRSMPIYALFHDLYPQLNLLCSFLFMRGLDLQMKLILSFR